MMQVDFSLQRDTQNMRRRYIEVFRCKKDYYNVVANEVNEPKSWDDAAPPSSYSKGSSKKDHIKHTDILKVRSLPFSLSKREIVECFKDYDVKEKMYRL